MKQFGISSGLPLPEIATCVVVAAAADIFPLSFSFSQLMHSMDSLAFKKGREAFFLSLLFLLLICNSGRVRPVRSISSPFSLEAPVVLLYTLTFPFFLGLWRVFVVVSLIWSLFPLFPPSHSRPLFFSSGLLPLSYLAE